MSVLNQSGEELVECPLCMEPLEVDDLNFYPCTCGYQICRFCWHRIRTDENGLCPACRKAYSENPADFTPLSKEQVAALKAEKRQRDQQKKAKLSESRKHLASVRVVQRNLVFVVGLPMRLADTEVLKRHEYFGKFGKIHKVVINQSTAYAGSQGPSASAYVTYLKSDDALRAIQSVNNITLDGRQIKSSLGTTKYCSHFMKNQPCPKPDCMYLHDFGDPEASFTKEQMHAGKHQEYERKLHEALQVKMAAQQRQEQQQQQTAPTEKPQQTTTPTPPTTITNTTTSTTTTNTTTAKTKESSTSPTNVDTWPQLTENGKKDEKVNNSKEEKKKEDKNHKNSCSSSRSKVVVCQNNNNNRERKSSEKIDEGSKDEVKPEGLLSKLDDNSSFFTQNAFQKLSLESQTAEDDLDGSSSLLNDSLPEISTCEDWEAAFGYTKFGNHLEELAHQQRNSNVDAFFFGGAANQTSELDWTESFTFKKDSSSILNKLNLNKSTNQEYPQNGIYKATEENGGTNGMDHMSKFFNDFSAKQKDLNGFFQTQNGIQNGGFPDQHLMLVHQKQLEDQILSNLKQQQFLQHNNGPQYMNGDATSRFYSFQSQFAQQRPKQNVVARQEDDLDFDPFQETQKGLAELIENDQSMKMAAAAAHMAAGGGTGQMNGLLHNNQNGNGMLPPPPPGFVQPHMNSFGSKILPYLNMNSQQQMNSTQNSWPSNYNNGLLQHQQQQQQQQQQQHKGIGACNDWKVLDPAIVSSSSRYFSLANVAPLRDQYNPLAQLGGGPTSQAPPQQPPQQNGPVGLRTSAYDFGNASYTSQMPPPQTPQGPPYNFSHLNAATQQNLHWLGADLSTQISSPPGFRPNGQTTKQQEC